MRSHERLYFYLKTQSIIKKIKTLELKRRKTCVTAFAKKRGDDLARGMISFYKQHSEHHPRQKPLPSNHLRIAILRRHGAVQLIHSRTATACFVPQPQRIITLIDHKEPNEEENRVNEIDFILNIYNKKIETPNKKEP